MKKELLTSFFGLFGLIVCAQDSTHSRLSDTLTLQPIEIASVRAADKAPFTKTNISKSEISAVNFGQDLPFVLNQTPSLVVSSDAGNGVGYTGMRIRGSDASRINITLNGIPYNDAESQGSFFVDMPDIASSAESIQIQRGVGTSSNGSGAFGASVHLSTHEENKEKYLEFNNSYGSFNTLKSTIKAGTGLIKNHFLFDVRASRIHSDGYIDRATSNLSSVLATAAYISEKNTVRFNVISGKEKTYQAWYGLPASMLHSNRTYNPAGTEKPGEPYDNETDNFLQTHYQVFYNHKFSNYLKLNTGVFLTRGKGYYEEYRANQKYSKYGVPDVVIKDSIIKKTDLVRQKWLDNYFYGGIFSFQYTKVKTNITFGGGLYQYDGGHYGNVIWAKNGGFPVNYDWYNNPAQKLDGNLYAKVMQSLGGRFTGFFDVQGRFVKYDLNGFRDNPELDIHNQYTFFNPKLGLSYNTHNTQIYASFSKGTKEPNRNDYEAGAEQVPSPEKLYDWELGVERKNKNSSFGVTLYYMFYRNQLVNTGKVNDVGAYTRTNTPESYRAGIELQGAAKITPWLYVAGNVAFSKNKISEFTEYVDDYDTELQKEEKYRDTDISFSPETVGFATVNLEVIKNTQISFQSKYVSRQFLDNTSNKERVLPGYFTEDVRLLYTFNTNALKKIDFVFQLNNIFDKKYSGNGYTYKYVEGGKMMVENSYFPMAGINFMASLNVTF